MTPRSSSRGVISAHDMLAELAEHNAFFDMVVDMIPSKLYIAGQSGDDFNPRYQKMPNKDSKESRRAEAKASKRRKLDPAQTESTVQVKQRLEESNGTTTLRILPAPASSPVAAKAATSSTPKAVSPHQSRIEALREKLHSKIAEKAGHRPPPDQVSKRAARRAMKEQRKQEQQKRAATSQVNRNASQPTVYKMDANGSRDNNVASDLQTLDFGRIAGWNHNQSTSSNYMESNKALKNLSKPKNIKKLLEDAEKKREKLEQLKQGSEDDQAKAKAMLWKDTLAEADGTRVKDDPHKLKKQLKRKVAKKKQSTKAWKTRAEGTKEAAQERQSIRSHNLNMRKVGGKAGANLSKKEIKTPGTTTPGKSEDEAGGRRQSRAGFEGRKQAFLNSGSKKNGKE
ncbi:hypothetical protein MPSEU_000802800 [Mayamaea pseudoterrestris]|nr:hypothetical protein MPSEU_000802800 [Mayamaea pseudoterrestris]